MERSPPIRRLFGATRYAVRISTQGEIAENMASEVEIFDGRYRLGKLKCSNFAELVVAVRDFWEEVTKSEVLKSRLASWFEDYFGSGKTPPEIRDWIRESVETHFSKPSNLGEIKAAKPYRTEEFKEPKYEEEVEEIPVFKAEIIEERMRERGGEKEGLDVAIKAVEEKEGEEKQEEEKVGVTDLYDLVINFLEKLGARDVIIFDEKGAFPIAAKFSIGETYGALCAMMDNLKNETSEELKKEGSDFKEVGEAKRIISMKSDLLIARKKRKIAVALSSPRVSDILQRISHFMESVLIVLNEVAEGRLTTKNQVKEVLEPVFMSSFDDFTIFQLNPEKQESLLKEPIEWQDLVAFYGEKALKVVNEGEGGKPLLEIAMRTGIKVDLVREIFCRLCEKNYATVNIMFPVLSEELSSFKGLSALDPDLFLLLQKAYPFLNGQHTLSEIAFLTGEQGKKLIQLLFALSNHLKWKTYKSAK